MTNNKQDLVKLLLENELIRRGFSDVVLAISELEKQDDGFSITEDDMIEFISEAERFSAVVSKQDH